MRNASKRKRQSLIDVITDNQNSYNLTGQYHKELLTIIRSKAVIREEDEYEERNKMIRAI